MTDSYSLFELNDYVKRVFALNFADPVWINCEISQVKESRGQLYLELIQKSEETQEILAQNQAVIWFKTHLFLKKKLGKIIDDILVDGVQVLLKVNVTYHERYGLKLSIVDIDPKHTIGQLELNRQQILERLQKEGKLEKNAQIDLPVALQKIAVISAETAAGFQDFKAQLSENLQSYHYSINLFPAALQGSNVEREVCNQLDNIEENHQQFDCIVIIRGGGSKIDLAGFDNYKIGAKIASSSLPVLTGIGHEIDDSISDIVAHTSLKTPTAVADFIHEHNLIFESSVNELVRHIKDLSREKLKLEYQDLEGLTQWLQIKPKDEIESQKNTLAFLHQQVGTLSRSMIKISKKELEFIQANCEISSPQNILKRGFALLKKEGKYIHSAKAVTKDDIITIEVSDGSIESKVL